MSGPGDNVTQVTQMPIPPLHYVKLYTDEAVKSGTAPKYATLTVRSNISVITIAFRPPPPIPDSYSMFGVAVNNDDAIIQSLESQVHMKLLILI